MVKINYDFYNGKDTYSDGDIEFEIIDNIKKHKCNYEKILHNNMNWNYYYYFSDSRSNFYKIYPFKKDSTILEVGAGMGAITSELCCHAKKVTSVELSDTRATAIYERNKRIDNLEIIVANFEDIEFKEKYDYIILNGILEYSKLYIHSSNPYEDFINTLKKLLNKDGKILIAIENKNGLKYWCGSLEDHTGKLFDGLRNYTENSIIKTFSKNELEIIVKNCGLYANFYYLFPDYKFPQIVYTDNSLNKNIFANYSPYYTQFTKTFIDERYKYREIYENGTIPFFSNSYMLELSTKCESPILEFAKFNNYRNKETNLVTYESNNYFYKKPLYVEGKQILKSILKINSRLNDLGLLTANITEENGTLKIERLSGENVNKILRKSCMMGNYEECYREIDMVVNKIFQVLPKSKSITNTIFEKFNIKVPLSTKESFNFVSDGFLDLTFNNIIKDKGSYYIFDQEWYEENVPIEYIIYRALVNFGFDNKEYNEVFMFLMDKYGLNKYLPLFSKLDSKFYSNILNNNYGLIDKNFNNNYQLVDNPTYLIYNDEFIHGLLNKIESLEKEKNEMNKVIDDVNILRSDYDSIVNSKRWRLINKILPNRKK